MYSILKLNIMFWDIFELKYVINRSIIDVKLLHQDKKNKIDFHHFFVKKIFLN